MNRRPPLSESDRAELCRVDFLAVLAGDGVEARKSGTHYVCRLRPNDKTPSCHVWPPGAGKHGGDGWTWHDYGDGKGGDALAYLVDVRGLDFMEAARLLADLTGYTPEALQGAPIAGKPPRMPAKPAPVPIWTPAPSMPKEAQAEAVAAFLRELRAAYPKTGEEGTAYLVRRGVMEPDVVDGAAYLLPADLCRPLAAKLAAGPLAPALLQAGILKAAQDGKPVRLAWWDRVCLVPCETKEGRPVYLVGRRVDWTPEAVGGKYINQGTAAGAVRYPLGLPALYEAARRRADLLLVEGPLDALGAGCLGFHALALCGRLQGVNFTSEAGAVAAMLSPHLDALLLCRKVQVVPDADAGDKGRQGEHLAADLVGWLKARGIRADVATLVDLKCPPECKDLADAAALKFKPKTEEAKT